MPTRDEALAVRPTIKDPTRLENGHAHPAYVQWLVRYSYDQEHPFHAFLTTGARPTRVSDERGYFDRRRVTKTLGPSGPKLWAVRGPLPTKPKIAALAELLGESVADLEEAVAAEREMRSKHETMLRACRSLPYNLLTYDQMIAGVACPGCGRPWIGSRLESPEEDALWQARHGECHAGRHSVGEGPQHCPRCCGYPAISPETRARLDRLLAEASDAAERRRQAEAALTPEVVQERADKRAKQRARRIARLEAELAELRSEEAGEDATRGSPRDSTYPDGP